MLSYSNKKLTPKVKFDQIEPFSVGKIYQQSSTIANIPFPKAILKKLIDNGMLDSDKVIQS
jgi:hypothetical protein